LTNFGVEVIEEAPLMNLKHGFLLVVVGTDGQKQSLFHEQVEDHSSYEGQ
jgi:hypothetical protein